VVDGAHRTLLAKEHGLEKIPIMQRSFPDIDSAKEECKRLNYDRRHLTQKQKEEERQERINRVVEARQEGKSTRAIAEEEGVSQKTIRDDMDKATEKGYSVDPPSGEVVGKDDKKHPAAQPKAYCSSCQTRLRKGQAVKENCEECKEMRNEKRKSKKKSSRAAKNGEVLFDWRGFHSVFGQLIRQIDEFGKRHKTNNSKEANDLRSSLGAWVDQFKAWTKEVTGEKAPTR